MDDGVLGCGQSAVHCQAGIRLASAERGVYSSYPLILLSHGREDNAIGTGPEQQFGAHPYEFARVSARGATLLPKSVTLADGALVEPLAVALRAVRLAAPLPESRVLIIGPGPIGLGLHFWLRQRGVRSIVVLASSDRRRGLAEAMGAAEIEAALGGKPDIVFEAAGVPGVVARAVQLVRPQGSIVALGFCMKPEPLVPGLALLKDINIRFSIVYTREDFENCARAFDRNAVEARALVTETVGMDDFPAAFEAFRSGAGIGKLLLDPWGKA